MSLTTDPYIVRNATEKYNTVSYRSYIGTKIIRDLCQQISSYSSMLALVDHEKQGYLPK